METTITNDQSVSTDENQSDELQRPEIWGFNDLKGHLTPFSVLPSSSEMPYIIDTGENMIINLQETVTNTYRNFGNPETTEKFREVEYKSYTGIIGANILLRTVVYHSEFSHDAPYRSYPPEFEFLMPVLNYNEAKSGKARGMILASSDVTMLALRTSETMLLTGNHIEPQYAEKMRMPKCAMPLPEPKRHQLVGVPKSHAAVQMLRFLEKCKYAGLEIYLKETFPGANKLGRYTYFERIDWADIV